MDAQAEGWYQGRKDGTGQLMRRAANETGCGCCGSCAPSAPHQGTACFPVGIHRRAARPAELRRLLSLCRKWGPRHRPFVGTLGNWGGWVFFLGITKREESVLLAALYTPKMQSTHPGRQQPCHSQGCSLLLTFKASQDVHL